MKSRRRKLLLTAILLAAVAAAIAWVADHIQTVREQTDFLASLRTSGGSLVMDYEADGQSPPRMPLWLRAILGDWPFQHVVKVAISSEDQLATVSKFAALQELDCGNTDIFDEEMRLICRCRHLKVLHLENANSDGEALEKLRSLPELVALDIGDGADASSTRLACFKHMPQLRILRLSGVDDKGVRRIRFLKQLEEMDLHESGIRGPGLSALDGMKHLRKLDLHQNEITGQYLVNLKNLELLEELDLSNTAVDNESMSALAGLRNLKLLNLMGTQVRGPGLRRLYPLKEKLRVRITLDGEDMEEIDGAVPIVALKLVNCHTDNGFYHLTLYPMLEELDLSESYLTDAFTEHLAGLSNLKTLDLSTTEISDAGLEHLRGMKELRTLNVRHTLVTPQGKQKLRAALPQVKFEGEE